MKKRRWLTNKKPKKEIDRKKEIERDALIGLALIAIIAVLYFFVKPALTGFIITESATKYWTMETPSEYIYDSQLINLSDGEARLMQQITLANITHTTEEDFEKGKKVNVEITNSSEIVLEKDKKEYKKSGFFVSEPMNVNGKTLEKIYWSALAPEGNSVKFQIRGADTEEALESAEFYGPTAISEFYAVSGESINSVHTNAQFIQYKAFFKGDSSTTPVLDSVIISLSAASYPSSASLETNDLSLGANVFSWIFNEISEGGIDYFYSTSSGGNWVSIQNGTSMNLTGVGKLRFKATLMGNGTATPILYEMSFTYISCTENWKQNYGTCLKNDSKLFYYTDENDCGTSFNVPPNNNSYIYCDYCTPNWLNANTSCNIDDIFSSWYYDSNECYAKTGLISDNNPPESSIYSCDYCAPNWSCSSYGDCQQDNKRRCLNVTDSNNCYRTTNLASDLYNGNYSEFLTTCIYDKTAPEITGFSAAPLTAVPGEIINISAVITDKSDLAATSAIKNIESAASLNLALAQKGNSIYTTSLNTSNLAEGVYELRLSAEDWYGNQASYNQTVLLNLVSKSKVSANTLTNSSLSIPANTTLTVDAVNAKLGITTNESVSDGIISITEYKSTPQNSTSEIAAGKFVDIILDSNTKRKVSLLQLKIYYTDEELSKANLEEATLKIYYYNESLNNWTVLKSFVNKAEKYVEANLSHTSTYGIFGQERQQTTSSASGGGGGGGGGGALIYFPPKEKQTVEEKISPPAPVAKETKAPESKPKTVELEKTSFCNYSILINLPEKISFIEEESAAGSIINTGCRIEAMKLSFSQPLKELIEIPNPYINNLEQGKNITFYLSLNPENSTSMKKLLIQGFAVKEIEANIKRQEGNFVVTAFKDEKAVAEENVPIVIEFIPTELFTKEKGGRQIFFLVGVFVFIVVILLFVMLGRKKRK